MSENRGRPKVTPQIVKKKYTREFAEYPNKPELGRRHVWDYDELKFKFGPINVQTIFHKDFKPPKVKIDKSKSYSNQPVVMVFKTSNRSNSKTKIKIWNNENIDYILKAKSLPGVPPTAIILELGVGVSVISKYKQKYKGYV